MIHRSSRSHTTFKPFFETVCRGLQRIGMLVRENIDLKVHLAFDDEAKVWYVAESDIPGLRLEADDPMELVRRLSDVVPDLIEMNSREILEAHESRKPKSVGFTPVFDNPFPVRAYA